MFNAHDNRAVSIASEIKGVEGEIARRQTELDTIVAFLVEQQVPAADVLNEQVALIDSTVERASSLLAEVEERMSAVATFGEEQRRAHEAATGVANAAANDQRTSAAQIERLTALAAQYDQDVKKLTFAMEANRLFDPLLITVCPWCLQPVERPDEVNDTCTICHQHLSSEPESGGSEFALDRELRAVKQRQRELSELLTELHESAASAEQTYADAVAEARRRQLALDRAMRARFAPFIDQRDALIAELSAAAQDRDQKRRYLAMHQSAHRRRVELGGLRQQVADLLAAQVEAEVSRSSRADAVALVSDRFAVLLDAFRFPKLSDAFVDSRYVPHVRNLVYSRLGSAGAGTLVSLAWYLSIFELSSQAGGPHPGLLLIDSPQKGLLASQSEEADEFQSSSIARAVYQHLIAWAAGPDGEGTQIIVVDNAPQSVAEEYVVARFSGSVDRPPYGLIDDAVG
jgi:hypothetical protein